MKVQGDDILSDVTEKTSRSLKATAAVVIAVKLFDVPVYDLRVLNVNLPPNLFDVTSFALILYMMITLVMYWRVDYLLWCHGSMMSAMNAIEGRLRSIKDVITDVEQFLKREVVDNVKFIQDQLGSMKVSVLEYRRSLAKTTWWVRFIIVGFHLAIPLTLGVFALWLVAEGAWAALSNLAG
jgi:hypothetical protein